MTHLDTRVNFRKRNSLCHDGLTGIPSNMLYIRYDVTYSYGQKDLLYTVKD